MQTVIALIILIIIYILYIKNVVEVNAENAITIDKERRLSKNVWNFIGTAIIDIGDGVDRLFIGGNEGQADSLFEYDSSPGVKRKSKNKFKDVINQTNLSNLSATYCITSADLRDIGRDDIIIGRRVGVCIYYASSDPTVTEYELRVVIQAFKDKVPLGVTVGDYNRDGRLDVYVSYMKSKDLLRKDCIQSKMDNNPYTNILLKNNGSTFEDVTNVANVGGYRSSFTSVFVDINNNGWVDILCANNDGRIELFVNNQNETFTPTFLIDKIGFWMGLGIGYMPDEEATYIFATNIGTSWSSMTFASLASGKSSEENTLTPEEKSQRMNEHLLIKYEGGQVVDISKSSGLNPSEFGRGGIFTDLNNDGFQDIVFGVNMQDLPGALTYLRLNSGHGAVFKYNKKQDKYLRIHKYDNVGESLTCVPFDFKKIGYPGLVWINHSTKPVAFANKEYKPNGKSNNNFVSVRLPSNAKYINATLLVTTESHTYRRQNIRSVGFGSDLSKTITIGIGKDSMIKNAKIICIDGTSTDLKTLKINQVV